MDGGPERDAFLIATQPNPALSTSHRGNFLTSIFDASSRKETSTPPPMSLDAIRLASEASVRDVLLGLCDDDRNEKRALVYFARLEPQHATTVANTSALNSPSAHVDTLNQASEASIRAILIAVCNDAEAKEAALAYLAQLEPDTVQIANNHPTAATRRVGKRKATGLAICVQCEEAFDESENGEVNECLYHAGEWRAHLDTQCQPLTFPQVK